MELLKHLQSRESGSVECCLHPAPSTLWALFLCLLFPPPLLCRVSAPVKQLPWDFPTFRVTPASGICSVLHSSSLPSRHLLAPHCGVPGLCHRFQRGGGGYVSLLLFPLPFVSPWQPQNLPLRYLKHLPAPLNLEIY